MRRYLLDTSFLVDLMRKHPGAISVHQRIKGKESTSIICVYELSKYSEAAGNAVFKKEVIPFEMTDAMEAASIHRELKSKGEIIPEMDIMIAGTALSRRMTIVTRDEHYKRVKGLDLELY